jgi:hypothetical protein
MQTIFSKTPMSSHNSRIMYVFAEEFDCLGWFFLWENSLCYKLNTVVPTGDVTKNEFESLHFNCFLE